MLRKSAPKDRSAAGLLPFRAVLQRLAARLRGARVACGGEYPAEHGLFALDDVACIRIGKAPGS